MMFPLSKENWQRAGTLLIGVSYQKLVEMLYITTDIKYEIDRNALICVVLYICRV
jgi:hypothetical protein